MNDSYRNFDDHEGEALLSQLGGNSAWKEDVVHELARDSQKFKDEQQGLISGSKELGSSGDRRPLKYD